jgi:hypothetical protein
VREVKELNKNHVGLLVGGLLGGWHLLWSVLVLLGFAKVLLGWVLWLHFITLPVTIQPFEIVRAGTLVVVTFIVGYVIGWIAAWIWGFLVKKV